MYVLILVISGIQICLQKIQIIFKLCLEPGLEPADLLGMNEKVGPVFEIFMEDLDP